MKESYTLTAYHCRNCGGVTDPDKEYCDYCSGKLLIKRFKNEMKKHNIRVLVECDEDYVYFDEIFSLMPIHEAETLDITSFEDDVRHTIHAPISKNELSVNMYLTDRGMQLYGKLNKESVYKTRFEFLDIDMAFEQENKVHFRMPDVAANEIPIVPVIFEAYSALKKFDTVVPDNACCPNCGAQITSRYGACDYCGGWVEWSF